MVVSQSTIKMEKGYYKMSLIPSNKLTGLSQSTIKMEKGYYFALLNNNRKK